MPDAGGAALRGLPSVDQLLQLTQAQALVTTYGRPKTVESIRQALADLRARLRTGPPDAADASDAASTSAATLPENIMNAAAALLETWMRPSLQPLINATGVILHTNLGRAPLSFEAAQAVQQAALGYTNLEFDLERGRRGSRLLHAEALLCQLTGAEAALVVNNNAAALLLALSALARRKRVIISRTQLVEVGGGFRIPEVMAQSGAKLVEVGSTNRVHLHDYQAALDELAASGEQAALVVRAHHSNFRIIGFTAEPSMAELAALAQQAGLPLVDDLGSGVLLDTARYGLSHEPTVQESLAAGADLVCFSGDKLLGGPQAGIVLGRRALIEKLKKHALARAVRADKLCLAALCATLLHYLKDEAEQKIPIWQMIAQPLAQIEARASRWQQAVGMGAVIAGHSTVGGGSLPEETLPTFLLALTLPRPNDFLARLRAGSPPVIARVENERVVLDPRTVLPHDEPALLAGLAAALADQRGVTVKEPSPVQPAG